MKQFNNVAMKLGFTLIEMLVVISIIAVLAGVGLATFTGAQKKSRDAKRKADLETIRSALEMYRADNGVYPLWANEQDGWEMSNDGDWLENLPSSYLPNKPLDPLHTGTGSYLGSYLYAPCTYSFPPGGQANYKLMAFMESEDNPQSCPPSPSCGGDLGGSESKYCIASP